MIYATYITFKVLTDAAIKLVIHPIEFMKDIRDIPNYFVSKKVIKFFIKDLFINY